MLQVWTAVPVIMSIVSLVKAADWPISCCCSKAAWACSNSNSSATCIIAFARSDTAPIFHSSPHMQLKRLHAGAEEYGSDRCRTHECVQQAVPPGLSLEPCTYVPAACLRMHGTG